MHTCIIDFTRFDSIRTYLIGTDASHHYMAILKIFYVFFAFFFPFFLFSFSFSFSKKREKVGEDWRGRKV